MSVATKHVFRRDKSKLLAINFCRDKRNFIETKVSVATCVLLSRQTRLLCYNRILLRQTFCRGKHTFCRDKRRLSRQKLCLWQFPPMIFGRRCDRQPVIAELTRVEWEPLQRLTNSCGTTQAARKGRKPNKNQRKQKPDKMHLRCSKRFARALAAGRSLGDVTFALHWFRSYLHPSCSGGVGFCNVGGLTSQAARLTVDRSAGRCAISCRTIS